MSKGGVIIKGLHIPPEGISLEKVEESLIREALLTSCGNQTRAAKLLDISRDSLRYRMHKFGIESVRGQLMRETWAQQSGYEPALLTETGERRASHDPTINRERRSFNRMQANFPVCIGDARSKGGDFAMGAIQDISMGGVCLSVPRGMNPAIGPGGEAAEFNISFSLPNSHWPIGVKCRPRRMVEIGDEVQIGAAFVDTDIRSHHALQQYLN
jgi:hypothetical protein